MHLNTVEEFLDHFINRKVRYDVLYLNDKELYKELYKVAEENSDKPEYQTLLGYLHKYGEAFGKILN